MLEFTYMWNFPNKIITPPRPNFKLLAEEESKILKKLTPIEISAIINKDYMCDYYSHEGENEDIAYAYRSYIDACLKTIKINTIMSHRTQDSTINEELIQYSRAHTRYVHIILANYRMFNILRCDDQISGASKNIPS